MAGTDHAGLSKDEEKDTFAHIIECHMLKKSTFKIKQDLGALKVELNHE
jgi:hypothetical protein